MSCDGRAQINVSNYLSIDDNESLFFKVLAGVVQSAAGPEDHRFVNILEMKSELATVAERIAHRLRRVMQVHHCFTHTMVREILGYVTDQRLSKHRQRRLSPVGSQR